MFSLFSGIHKKVGGNYTYSINP